MSSRHPRTTGAPDGSPQISSSIFYRDARAAGTTIVRELETAHDGDCNHGALDSDGHVWFFGQRVDPAARDVATDEHRVGGDRD